MAKFDEQLNRMSYLMEYKTPQNKGIATGIEYNTKGADGKVYGIIKEGTKYYIKTTEVGKENLCESYSYINGINCRKENEYSSYNEATKHLEMKLMSLNEAKGIKKDVSTVDFHKNEKTYASLTEEARKELNRMTQIMENCGCCGCKPVGQGFGTADTKENNKPFDEEAKATLDKDNVASEDDAKATGDFEKVDDAEEQLTSIKAPKGGNDSTKGEKAPQPESDGVAVVAEKGKSEFKAIKMNEGLEGDEELDYELSLEDDIDDINNDEEEDGEDSLTDDMFEVGDYEEFDDDDDDLVGFGVEIEECGDMDECGSVNEEDVISGDNDVMTGKQKGTLSAQTVDKINEMACKASKRIVKQINEEKAVKNYIARLVKEEAESLNIWGKHPKYGKEPFTTPENKEVLKGTATKDWNDDSAKKSVRYGISKGKSNPFDEKVEDMTKAVLAIVMESLKKKN